MSADKKLNIDVPETFSQFKENAVARLSYLEPELTFASVDGGIEVECSKAFNKEQITDLRETIFHQLYRAKIYQETLPIRQWLNSDE